MQTNMNELVSYCLESMEPDGINILGYWERNETVYPTLAMMAHDIFIVPVSIVPSESCISSANRILTDKRSRLGAKAFKRLVCLKDWFDAEQRNQHAPVE
jgi:hAT family C-terminal dimerisation region